MPVVSASKTSVSAWHRADRLKTCTMCGEAKLLDQFYPFAYTAANGVRGTRYESRCRPCARQRRMDQYRADPEKHRAMSNRWKDGKQEHLREYRKVKQKDADHRALKAKGQRLRKARMRSGQPNDPAIKAIYAEAMRIEKLVANCPVFDIPELGHKIHVDHVIPLARGGQHIASNLQIIPIGINMRKGTKCPS